MSFDPTDWQDALRPRQLPVRRVAEALVKVADDDGRFSHSNRALRFMVAKLAGITAQAADLAMTELRRDRFMVRLITGEVGRPSEWTLQNPNGSVTTSRSGRAHAQR